MSRSPSTLQASFRIFDLSIGEMLWSRRTIFMGLVVGLPVLIFELYGGIGIGGIYVDFSGLPQNVDNSDFVAAMQAFLGVEFGLGGVGVGAEYKYVASDNTNADLRIEGGVAQLFVTMPF